MKKQETITAAQYKEMYGSGSKAIPKPGKKKKSTKNYLGDMKMVLLLAAIPFETEYRFHDKRMFRFDIAFPEKKISVEYEGLMSAKSRHTTKTGYSKDCDKYNLAQSMGWTVLRYTALNYRNLIDDIRKLFGNA